MCLVDAEQWNDQHPTIPLTSCSASIFSCWLSSLPRLPLDALGRTPTFRHLLNLNRYLSPNFRCPLSLLTTPRVVALLKSTHIEPVALGELWRTFNLELSYRTVYTLRWQSTSPVLRSRLMRRASWLACTSSWWSRTLADDGLPPNFCW